ncbi:hypothetical protein MRX96_059615, partial [Rhipicephalus microplus]
MKHFLNDVVINVSRVGEVKRVGDFYRGPLEFCLLSTQLSKPLTGHDRLCSVVLSGPPSQSLNSYGTADDVRSPTGSAGTPGPMPQQPSSQQSTDNNSEAGKSVDSFSLGLSPH